MNLNAWIFPRMYSQKICLQWFHSKSLWAQGSFAPLVPCGRMLHGSTPNTIMSSVVLHTCRYPAVTWVEEMTNSSGLCCSQVAPDGMFCMWQHTLAHTELSTHCVPCAPSTEASQPAAFSLDLCMRISCSPWRTLHVSLLNFRKFLLAESPRFSRSLWTDTADVSRSYQICTVRKNWVHFIQEHVREVGSKDQGMG